MLARPDERPAKPTKLLTANIQLTDLLLQDSSKYSCSPRALKQHLGPLQQVAGLVDCTETDPGFTSGVQDGHSVLTFGTTVWSCSWRHLHNFDNHSRWGT